MALLTNVVCRRAVLLSMKNAQVPINVAIKGMPLPSHPVQVAPARHTAAAQKNSASSARVRSDKPSVYALMLWRIPASSKIHMPVLACRSQYCRAQAKEPAATVSLVRLGWMIKKPNILSKKASAPTHLTQAEELSKIQLISNMA